MLPGWLNGTPAVTIICSSILENLYFFAALAAFMTAILNLSTWPVITQCAPQYKQSNRAVSIKGVKAIIGTRGLSPDTSLAVAPEWVKQQSQDVHVIIGMMNNKDHKKYINFSAKKISNKLKVSSWKKQGVINFDETELKTDLKAAIILPDGIPGSPVYLVFANYEKILKWNRSLRFAISVCTLAEMTRV